MVIIMRTKSQHPALPPEEVQASKENQTPSRLLQFQGGEEQIHLVQLTVCASEVLMRSG